mmetsp:Transcript_11877/g.17373  ORF Transcript_11877/g.17373 Transcript_11877/m.17373 type:complete len:155 (+) Transcript_11877:999-1463(+)|eukprot:CAMPEP_0194089860 /NCGR_PEP_ID=MMETSP0149-20130528/36491_1 /TAXON_ID=122233 /ORGANISM="Chaetoceros debilis, Strain MM31A-1" /LENGTH=154 /DNA_ID=CAMNT_0038773939 /DNA_START=314 /DNA_END=778 /DNA_ORIENTATION=-
MQQLIHECTWDEKTGKPLTKLDRELDDILKTGEDLDYVDMTLLMAETERPNETIASDTFIPQLDTNSVFTFGTVNDITPKTAGLTNTQVIDVEEKSALSGITLDSRISVMEQEFSSISDMLRILISRANNGSTDTHPTTTQEAGGTDASPVHGV